MANTTLGPLNTTRNDFQAQSQEGVNPEHSHIFLGTSPQEYAPIEGVYKDEKEKTHKRTRGTQSNKMRALILQNVFNYLLKPKLADEQGQTTSGFGLSMLTYQGRTLMCQTTPGGFLKYLYLKGIFFERKWKENNRHREKKGKREHGSKIESE